MAGDRNYITTGKPVPPILNTLPDGIANFNTHGGEGAWVKVLKAEDELGDLVALSRPTRLVGEKRQG